MTTITYEDERTVITVRVPAHAPILTWSQAFVRQGSDVIEVTTTIPEARVVEVVIPADTLVPGLCDLRVRAGATEVHARTVCDEKILVRRALRPSVG